MLYTLSLVLYVNYILITGKKKKELTLNNWHNLTVFLNLFKKLHVKYMNTFYS